MVWVKVCAIPREAKRRAGMDGGATTNGNKNLQWVEQEHGGTRLKAEGAVGAVLFVRDGGDVGLGLAVDAGAGGRVGGEVDEVLDLDARLGEELALDGKVDAGGVGLALGEGSGVGSPDAVGGEDVGRVGAHRQDEGWGVWRRDGHGKDGCHEGRDDEHEVHGWFG